MEVKKNDSVDVEQKKSRNLLIGLNIALILTYGLMSFTNKPEDVKFAKKNISMEAIEEIPQTEQEPPKAPPPPPSPDIEEIDDDSDVEEDPPPSTEASEDFKIPENTNDGKDDGKGKEDIKLDMEIYLDVDIEASFPGGVSKLHEFVRTQFNMPKAAQELGIGGVILIQFVVERDGKITDIRAVAPESRRLGYGLEQECMRILKLSSGQWTPASRLGKGVRSYWRFPFEIDNSGGF